MEGQELPPVTFALADTPELVWRAKRLELEVFCESGFVADTVGDEIPEYVPYSPYSEFLVAITNKDIIGVVRRIRPSPAGLPTLNFFALSQRWQRLLARELELGRVEEMCTAAVRREYQGKGNRGILSGLVRASWQGLLLGGRKWVISSLDYKLANIFKTFFVFDMRLIGPAKHFMGSLTVPMAVDIHHEARTLLQKAPHIAAYLFEGMDMERLAAILRESRRPGRAG